MAGILLSRDPFSTDGTGQRALSSPSMRRLLRWAINGAAAVSAMLFVATCVLWVMSYNTDVRVPFIQRGVRWEVVSASGCLALDDAPQRALERRKWADGFRGAQGEYNSSMLEWGRRGGLNGSPDTRLHRAFLSLQKLQNTPPILTSFVQLSLPYYVPFAAALPLTIVTTLWLIRIHRPRHRQKHGLSASCGYDLRATPHRCPECGAVRNARTAI